MTKTERLTLIFPKYITRKMKEEAERRIIQRNMHGNVGKKTIKVEMRDVICLGFINGFKKVNRMSFAEYEQAVKDLHRRRS